MGSLPTQPILMIKGRHELHIDHHHENMSFCTPTQQPPGLEAFSSCQTAQRLGWTQAKQCYLPPKYLFAILSIACLNTEPVLLLPHWGARSCLCKVPARSLHRGEQGLHTFVKTFLSSSAPAVISSHTSIGRFPPPSYRSP